MSDKNHLGQTNAFAIQDRWSGDNFGLKLMKMVRSAKNLIGQAKAQALTKCPVMSLQLS